MKKEAGSIPLFILVLVVIIIVVILLFWEKGSVTILKHSYSSSEPIKRVGESVDLSHKPPARYLADYINHCINTSGYHLSGSDCVHN